MTERENGGTAVRVDWASAGSAKGETAPARLEVIAAVAAAPAQAPKKSRRRTSGSQQFGADVFQDVGGTFDSHFAGEDGVFVLDAEDAFEADVHVGLDNLFPEVGAMAVADGAEGFRGQRQVLGFECKIQHAVFVYVV